MEDEGGSGVAHQIRQYTLEPGALEIQYMEEYFDEFRGKKTAEEIIERLQGRQHLILLALASLPEEPDQLFPVAFKVGHEIRRTERDPKLRDLVTRLAGCVNFAGRRIFYSWIGGTRREWRGQGHYRALTEQQEEWAARQGFHELVVKTKNRFYPMRATLDHMRFDVVKFEPHPDENAESKLYLSKKLLPEGLEQHRTLRRVEEAAEGPSPGVRQPACRQAGLLPLWARPVSGLPRLAGESLLSPLANSWEVQRGAAASCRLLALADGGSVAPKRSRSAGPHST